ncbi:hypothetical protein Tco_1509094 [Tanacetum coccineum]
MEVDEEVVIETDHPDCWMEVDEEVVIETTQKRQRLLNQVRKGADHVYLVAIDSSQSLVTGISFWQRSLKRVRSGACMAIRWDLGPLVEMMVVRRSSKGGVVFVVVVVAVAVAVVGSGR